MTRAPILMIFDADCVLCSRSVHFILARERGPSIRFINAWSAEGLAVAGHHGLTREELNRTYLVVRDGRGFTRSDAVLVILQEMRAPWSWFGPLLRVVPRRLRDAGYSAIASRRYRWFGRQAKCFRPPPGMGDRFVDD